MFDKPFPVISVAITAADGHAISNQLTSTMLIVFGSQVRCSRCKLMLAHRLKLRSTGGYYFTTYICIAKLESINDQTIDNRVV